MAEQPQHLVGRYGDWEPTEIATGKLPALTVDPIHGVLPFSGARNPLTRSNTARRVSMAIATQATQGVPQVYHFESEGESAVAIDALLHPDLHALEVQPPAVQYLSRAAGKLRKHHFDMRVTFRDGFRRAIFVRHGASLMRSDTRAEIADIFAAVSSDFVDDCVVVRTDDYSRAYRDEPQLFRLVTRVRFEDIDLTPREDGEPGEYTVLNDIVGSYALRMGVKVANDLHDSEFLHRLATAAAFRWGIVIQLVIAALEHATAEGNPILTRAAFDAAWASKTGTAEIASPFAHVAYQAVYRRDGPFESQFQD